MNLKEIAAIAMDEADALAQEALSELVPTEDRKKNFYKATVKQGVKGASVAPASASVPKPKDPATTGPKEPQVDKAAKHAQQYPGSFGNLECFSKSKDGCPKHKTGIYADAGSKFAKLDASGKQVMATEEQRKNAKADDEPDNIGEAQKPAEGAQKPADATVSPEVQKNVAALAKEATEGKDPAAVEQKATAAAEEAAKSLSAPEAKNVGTLNALAQTGYGDKVIDAMVNVVNNEKATEADKVAAAATAVSAIAALQKDAAEGKVSQEQLSAAYEKLEKVTSAAAQKAEEKLTEAEAPKTSENKTLRIAPSKEEQAKMAAAIKNSYGGLYNDFMKDVAAVPDGQCFAAGDDPSEDHYFVKKDGKIYRADANDQPIGDALTADEVMCAMIGEGHLWSDGKRTAGAVPETGEALAEQPANPAEPAKAPEAEAPQPEKPAEQPAPSSAQPKEETAKPETAEQPATEKPSEQPAATEHPSQTGEAGGTETAAAQPAETAETTTTETATSETTETAEGTSETTETETKEITQADIDAAKQNDKDFNGAVTHLNEKVNVGETVLFNDADGNPDSGLNKMVKQADGRFYRVDEDGKPTGQGYTAEQAYLEMKNNLDPVPKGQSIEEHLKNCKAHPPSNCPFLRQQMAKMTPEQQHQVFGGEKPQPDGQPVTAPSLKSLVDSGALGEGVARAIETGLTPENTGLKDEDLDALRETAAKALADSGEESIRRSLADLANRAAAKKINVTDPADRDRAVESSVRNAFVETTEESLKRADGIITRYENALKSVGKKMAEADKERIRRNAAIEVYNETQRADRDALAETLAEMTSMGEGVAQKLMNLEGRQLTPSQRDNIESYKKIIREAKNEKAKLTARRQLEDYIRDEGLDRPKVSHESWDNIALDEDFGKSGGASEAAEKARSAYENELKELRERLATDKQFSKKDFNAAVAVAKSKAQQAGYDPSMRMGGDIYAAGLDSDTYDKMLSGDSKGLAKAKAAVQSPKAVAEHATENALSVQELIDDYQKKHNVDALTVGDATVKGNKVTIPINVKPGQNGSRILKSMRDDIARALKEPDLKIEVVSDSGDALITYSHKGQDFHMLSEEFKSPEAREKFEKAAVPVILGRAGDESIIEDLRGNPPSMFIAGQTRSGKSTTAKNILAGWFMKDPRLVKPFVIDPKGEFKQHCEGTSGVGYTEGYDGIVDALDFLTDEAVRRQKVLGGQTIDKYNETHPDNPMPMMPVLFDELGNVLTKDNGPAVAKKLEGLAKICASAGINLVVLSQGTEGIPQSLLGQLGRRVTYNVASNNDSQRAMGAGHHEARTAKKYGDGYYQQQSGGEAIRIQAPMMNEDPDDVENQDMPNIVARRNAMGKKMPAREKARKGESMFSVSAAHS